MFTIKYGNNHEEYFANYEDAKNRAYYLAFYYTVYIDGKLFERIF